MNSRRHDKLGNIDRRTFLIGLTALAGCSSDATAPQQEYDLDAATAEDACYGEILPVTNDAPALFPSGCAPGNETTVTFEATGVNVKNYTPRASENYFLKGTSIQ